LEQVVVNFFELTTWFYTSQADVPVAVVAGVLGSFVPRWCYGSGGTLGKDSEVAMLTINLLFWACPWHGVKSQAFFHQSWCSTRWVARNWDQPISYTTTENYTRIFSSWKVNLFSLIFLRSQWPLKILPTTIKVTQTTCACNNIFWSIVTLSAPVNIAVKTTLVGSSPIRERKRRERTRKRTLKLMHSPRINFSCACSYGLVLKSYVCHSFTSLCYFST